MDGLWMNTVNVMNLGNLTYIQVDLRFLKTPVILCGERNSRTIPVVNEKGNQIIGKPSSYNISYIL
jgi:hypothetical protein